MRGGEVRLSVGGLPEDAVDKLEMAGMSDALLSDRREQECRCFPVDRPPSWVRSPEAEELLTFLLASGSGVDVWSVLVTLDALAQRTSGGLEAQRLPALIAAIAIALSKLMHASDRLLWCLRCAPMDMSKGEFRRSVLREELALTLDLNTALCLLTPQQWGVAFLGRALALWSHRGIAGPLQEMGRVLVRMVWLADMCLCREGISAELPPRFMAAGLLCYTLGLHGLVPTSPLEVEVAQDEVLSVLPRATGLSMAKLSQVLELTIALLRRCASPTAPPTPSYVACDFMRQVDVAHTMLRETVGSSPVPSLQHDEGAQDEGARPLISECDCDYMEQVRGAHRLLQETVGSIIYWDELCSRPAAGALGEVVQPTVRLLESDRASALAALELLTFMDNHRLAGSCGSKIAPGR